MKKVQVILEEDIKRAAGDAAYRKGFASLSAYFRYTATKLAEQESASVREPLGVETKVPPRFNSSQSRFPDPNQFTVWPPYFSKESAQRDPELFSFYIKIGIIR
jgi:hypothetical protein